MHKDITGIILADTSIAKTKEEMVLSKISEETIIEHLYNIIKPIFTNIIIIAFNPDEFKDLKAKIYPEIYVSKGPLAQIHAGLFHSLTERNFIISSDYPFITREMINYIINYETESQIVLPKAEGNVQILSGIYTKQCIPVAEDILNKSISQEADYFASYNTCYKVSRMIDRIGAKLIPAELLPNYNSDIFFNIREDELQELI
jgi:molybdenum cofactor guanylyltransferase